jgi:hypothetical protein
MAQATAPILDSTKADIRGTATICPLLDNSGHWTGIASIDDHRQHARQRRANARRVVSRRSQKIGGREQGLPDF